MSAVFGYLIQVGIAFDMMLNAILGGDAGQTLSYRAALGMEARKPFWCLFCRILSWWVQHDHCADQLTGVGMNDSQYLRAFAGLLILVALIFYPAYFVIFATHRLV